MMKMDSFSVKKVLFFRKGKDKMARYLIMLQVEVFFGTVSDDFANEEELFARKFEGKLSKA